MSQNVPDDLAEALAFLQQACESPDECERSAARFIYAYFERELLILTGKRAPGPTPVAPAPDNEKSVEFPNRDRRYFNA